MIAAITRTGLALMASAVLAAGLAAPAGAADGAPSPAQLLELLQAQQRQINDLKAELEKARRNSEEAVAKAEQVQETKPSQSFLDTVQVGGVIEVEATNASDFTNADTSDIALAKVEAFIDTQPTDWISTHVQFLFEDGNANITLDEAFATIGNTEKFPFYARAGQYVVPFGNYDTALASDPLTLDLAETKEAAVLVGGERNGFSAQAYVYNGDSQRAGSSNHIDQGGFFLGYIGAVNETEVDTGVGYITNIADSDGLTDGLGGNATALSGYVGGFAAHGSLTWRAFNFRGGYITALESFAAGELAFNGQGAEPKAWNLEASYTTPIMGKETIFAATWQGTDEALALGLAEERYGGAVTVGVLEHAAVTAEYLHNEDYGASDGGTGEDSHTATLKLAVDF